MQCYGIHHQHHQRAAARKCGSSLTQAGVRAWGRWLPHLVALSMLRAHNPRRGLRRGRAVGGTGNGGGLICWLIRFSVSVIGARWDAIGAGSGGYSVRSSCLGGSCCTTPASSTIGGIAAIAGRVVGWPDAPAAPGPEILFFAAAALRASACAAFLSAVSRRFLAALLSAARGAPAASLIIVVSALGVADAPAAPAEPLDS
jgi:hypothetical protein